MQSLQEEKKKNIGNISLFQLCWEFLKIGTIGFGGGWVIISMIKHRFVEQKQLITDEDFTIGISLSQFLGAFAVNTTSFIGRKLKGIWGSILSTFFFLLPSFVIVCVLTGLYFKFNKLFNFQYLLKGISPVIIALMLSTAFDLSIKIKKDIGFLLIISLVIIGGILNINYVVLLLFSGFFQVLYSHFIKEKEKNLLPIFFIQPNKISYGLPVLFSMIGTPSIITISFIFFGIGFIFFGGGYALLPLLQNIFVNKLHWISNHDFIVGIAISQATPGPFAIIATFLGYYLHGILGALFATFMIFLPAFLFLQILINLQNNFKDNKNVQSFLRGINIAIIGQLILLSYHFFLVTLLPISVISIILLLTSFLFFFIYRIPPLVFIVIGLVYGFFFIK
ncbi:MAG TPA: chromate efflux transporter [Candidatus Hydrogenedens sp.]|nr:chromate efflux transporter [Candidatus Hydrogenedens sp.]